MFIADTSADNTHFVDQTGQPRLVISENIWGLLANAAAWSGTYQTNYDTYFAQRATQGYTMVEVSWCSFPQPNGAFVNTNGRDWDGTWPFATTIDPTTAAVSAFWDRRDYFFAAAAAKGITVNMNMSTPWLGFADCPVRNWTTAQWTAFGTFIGNRYKNVPNIVWTLGDDYFGDRDTELAAWITALRATGDTHLLGTFNYAETTSRLTLDTLVKDPVSFDVNSQFEWVYSYNVTYDGIEKAHTYTPTGSDLVQGVVPPVWGDGHYLASGVGGGQTDVRLARQMIWWAFSSGAAGISLGDNDVWPWASGSAALVTSKTFYSAWMPAIVKAFSGLTGWQKLIPDTSSVLVTAGRGTHAAPLASGGGGGQYTANTDAYVTASRTPDTGSGSALAVIYCGLAFSITIDQSKMISGYTATWLDPVNGAAQAGTAGSTYNSTTAVGNNSAGDPDWVLVLRAGG